MNKQVTFGHILTILSVIVIPLMVWGVNIETRFEKVLNNTNLNTKEIVKIKSENKSITETMNAHQIELIDKLHGIELQLKDKKDRE